MRFVILLALVLAGCCSPPAPTATTNPVIFHIYPTDNVVGIITAEGVFVPSVDALNAASQAELQAQAEREK